MQVFPALDTAAIMGGIVGSADGKAGIAHEVWEWPRSVTWMERLAVSEVRSGGKSGCATCLPVLPRNLFFMAVVLAHGFRRLLPPY